MLNIFRIHFSNEISNPLLALASRGAHFSLLVCVFDTVLQYEMNIGEVFCNDSLTVLSLFSHKS